MNVVLIETSGNQRYVFSTNKLRENVGASELTYQVGTKYVLEAVEKHSGRRLWDDDDTDGRMLRANLLDRKKNPAIEDTDAKVEVVVATSGKAILLVKDQSVAEKIVGEVTRVALEKMPGLMVHGAVCQTEDDLDRVGVDGGLRLHAVIGDAHRKLNKIRYAIPSNEQRFLRLPFVSPCDTSGLPASSVQFFNPAGRNYSLSQVTSAKWNSNKTKGKNPTKRLGRIESVINGASPSITLPKNLDKLEEVFGSEWLAVIHADGNGLGQIFLDFQKCAGIDSDGSIKGRQYIEDYRSFSLALDACTINAASDALESLQHNYREEQRETAIRQGQELGNIREEIPVVPLVLGGDDLTLFCDGQYALSFTHNFLTNFEKEAQHLSQKDYLTKAKDGQTILIDGKTVYERLKDIVPRIASKMFGSNCLGICAGVAIIKPHYPFHQAYQLAEQLLRSAKQVKEEIKHTHIGLSTTVPASALDFHILYDSAHSELTEMRGENMKVVGEETYLFAKPYVVTNENSLSGQGANTWLQHRKFGELKRRVRAMHAPAKDDDTRRALPNGKLHEIRQSLFRGKEAAKAEVGLIRNRLKAVREEFDQLLSEDSIFFMEGNKNYTHFLDAIEAVEFWKGFDTEIAGQQPDSEGDK
jgi:hypothetical protein